MKKVLKEKIDAENGIAAELYTFDDSARIRVYDIDAGGNYNLTIYPTLAAAEKVFNEIKTI